MNRFASLFFLVFGLVLTNFLPFSAATAPNSPADPAVVGRIDQFLKICTANPDMLQAGLQVVAAGLVHNSKLDPNNPSQLNRDSLNFSFKKAFANAKFYDPRIVRVAEMGVTAIGHGETASRGKLYKYFVAKKNGVGGMPAPIHIFFPADGQPPVLYDWGSL